MTDSSLAELLFSHGRVVVNINQEIDVKSIISVFLSLSIYWISRSTFYDSMATKMGKVAAEGSSGIFNILQALQGPQMAVCLQWQEEIH